ncbi:MAG TPA: hypothetical protein VF941_22470 [Clostridia bacterium]
MTKAGNKKAFILAGFLMIQALIPFANSAFAASGSTDIYIPGDDVYIPGISTPYDYDGDGKITSKDIAIMKRIILGMWTSPIRKGQAVINSTDYSKAKRSID